MDAVSDNWTRVPGAQAIGKALYLVDLIADSPCSLQELCLRSGLPRPTVVRLLAVLRGYGYIQGRYDQLELGTRFLELGACLRGRTDLVAIASSHLKTLAETYSETAFLCVRDERETICIDRVESPHSLRLAHSVGARSPLHAGALAKTLLAFAPASLREAVLTSTLEQRTPNTITDQSELRRQLEQIREVGFGESDGEGTEGVSAVAAPIREATGEVVAAIAIAGPTDRFRRLPCTAIRGDVTRAGDEISRKLGWVR